MREKVKLAGMGLIVVMILVASSGGGYAQPQITFWTTEVEEDQIGVQQKLADNFMKKVPEVKVEVVPVLESELVEKIAQAFRAEKLPHVIFHPMDYTISWAQKGILDPQAASDLIDDLGVDTFAPAPLNLVKYEEKFAALPADGWGLLLLYRADLFQEKGLTSPDTWDSILKAAQVLHNPPLMWGIEVGTDPAHVYTQQVFEHFALSNNARLVDPATGKVNLNTPQFIKTLRFYKELSEFTPPGNLYSLHTRLDYLSGRCAMILWPPFILDELSGLEEEYPVLVKENKKKTGFVTLIKGPEAEAQYGQVNCFGITRGGEVKVAQEWVKFLLSEGYLSWLGMAAEAKLPMRKGTKDETTKFIQGWGDLPLAGESKVSQFYSPEVINLILSGSKGFDRWGLAQGKGSLVARIYATKVIPKVLKRYLGGDIFTAEAAAGLMDDLVRGLEEWSTAAG